MDAAQAFAVTAAVTTGYYDILTGPDSMKALFQVHYLTVRFPSHSHISYVWLTDSGVTDLGDP